MPQARGGADSRPAPRVSHHLVMTTHRPISGRLLPAREPIGELPSRAGGVPGGRGGGRAGRSPGADSLEAAGGLGNTRRGTRRREEEGGAGGDQEAPVTQEFADAPRGAPLGPAPTREEVGFAPSRQHSCPSRSDPAFGADGATFRKFVLSPQRKHTRRGSNPNKATPLGSALVKLESPPPPQALTKEAGEALRTEQALSLGTRPWANTCS